MSRQNPKNVAFFIYCIPCITSLMKIFILKSKGKIIIITVIIKIPTTCSISMLGRR